ncbi:ester cyclase [Streptomyces sp. NPDC090493]|uniref:nuclear transport factor 2 family protein n=1 Tax=Streptomyces sp. NPDC090493 TaxID=3365964 RepID=UPI003810BE53
MTDIEDRNRALALEALDALFNKRDYTVVERFWSPDYIQHSSCIAPGRNGILEQAKSMPTLRYECELAMAEGDMVMLRGRFSGNGQATPWIVAHALRIENGLLAEHWDVVESEATRAESLSGLPSYGNDFPEDR